VTQVFPEPAEGAINLTVSSPTPFSLFLDWEPGDAGECVFMYWDVQFRTRRNGTVHNRWYGDILFENETEWGQSISECFSAQTRKVTNCTVTGLESNAIYDVRLAERCNDTRADGPWVEVPLQRTIAAWALTPQDVETTNVTETTFNLSWTADLPRDCIFRTWTVEVKPSPILDWVPVPECSLPLRNNTDCNIVGLQSNTWYDLRVQEQCVHEEADSPDALFTPAIQTLLGTVLHVGSNPLSNSKIITFGTEKFNACAYLDKCCSDEFSLCYSSNSFELARTDIYSGGWGQNLHLSCVMTPLHYQS